MCGDREACPTVSGRVAPVASRIARPVDEVCGIFRLVDLRIVERADHVLDELLRARCRRSSSRSTLRPRCITISRSDTAKTSGSVWVIRITGTP